MPLYRTKRGLNSDMKGIMRDKLTPPEPETQEDIDAYQMKLETKGDKIRDEREDG